MSVEKWFMKHGLGSIGDSAKTILNVYENLELKLPPNATRNDLFCLTLKTRRDHIKKLVKEPLFDKNEVILKDVKTANGDIFYLVFSEIEHEYPALKELKIKHPNQYNDAKEVVGDIVKRRFPEEYRIKDAMKSGTFWADISKNAGVPKETIKLYETIGKEKIDDEFIDTAVSSNYRSEAYYHIKNKEIKKAKLACLRALRIDNGNALSWIVFGNISLQQHDFIEAIYYYLQALKCNEYIKKNPTVEIQAYASLSMASSLTQNFQKAKEALEKAKEIAKSKSKEILDLKSHAKGASKYGLFDDLGNTDDFTVENMIIHAEHVFEQCYPK